MTDMKTVWAFGEGGSNADDVFVELFYGTKEEAKERIAKATEASAPIAPMLGNLSLEGLNELKRLVELEMIDRVSREEVAA